VMRPEYLACALVELMEIGKTSSGADRVLHDPPETFDGIEVVPTMSREEMEAQLAVVVLKGRVELVRPMDAAAIDDQHDLLIRVAEGRHDLLEILTQLLGIKVWHDFVEDFGGPILDGPKHAQQDPTGDAAPGAIRHPGLAFEGLLTLDLTRAQRADGEAGALGGAPPAGAGQGQAPEDRVIGIEPNKLPTTSLILEGRQFQSPISEVSGVGL
jgi:hypothetical protein